MAAHLNSREANPLLRGAFPACIAIALLMLGSQGVRATTVLMTFSAGNDQTWTCPLGVTNVTVECWGAGGAGGILRAGAYPNLIQPGRPVA